MSFPAVEEDIIDPEVCLITDRIYGGLIMNRIPGAFHRASCLKTRRQTLLQLGGACCYSSSSSANYWMCFGKCEESHLGKCLLIVVSELLRIDVEMVLVDGEWVIVSGLFWDKLLHFHGHLLTLLLKRLHRNIRWCDRVCGDEGYKLNTFHYLLTLMMCFLSSENAS